MHRAKGPGFGGRPWLASRIGLLAGIVLAITSGSPAAVGLVFAREPASAGVYGLDSSACSTLFSINLPQLNYDRPQFETVCNEPSFANASVEWGWSNFTLGSTSTASYLLYFPGFTWTRNCSSPWGCADEIYWTLNVTSGNVSGPTTAEYGPARLCFGCPARTAPPPATGPGLAAIPILWIGVLGGAAATATGYSLMARRPGRRWGRR